MVFTKRPVTTQINFLFHKKKKAQVSERISRFFIALQIILSLDFGFAKYTTSRQKWAIKILTLLQSAVISTTCIVYLCLYLSTFQAIWYSVFCTQYFMYVLVLVFSDPKRSFAELEKDLTAFDYMIGVESDSYNLDVYMLLSCLSVLVFRITVSCVFCSFNSDHCVNIPVVNVIYFIPLICNDVVQLMYSYTFYFAYKRIKKYTEIIKVSTNIIHCHYLYKNLVEAIEKVKEAFDAVFLVSLLYNVPECMASVFFTLKQIITQGKLAKTFSFGGYLTTTQSLVVIFSPAFSAGLLANEVQKIKLVLHDKLFLERDQRHTKDIKRLISYIEARPLRFTILKIIPLDWRLPFLILNLATTYLIVVVQFSHFDI